MVDQKLPPSPPLKSVLDHSPISGPRVRLKSFAEGLSNEPKYVNISHFESKFLVDKIKYYKI
jgi:hypothetical protein